MVAFGYYGEMIPVINDDTSNDIFIVICKNADDCRKMIRNSGWQADFSCMDCSGGVYHFDDMIGMIHKVDLNISTLLVALRDIEV